MKTSTFSSANFTEGNTLLKECVQMMNNKIKVYIGWRRTGVYYTDKLPFSNGSSIKVLGCVLYRCAYYIRSFTVRRQQASYTVCCPSTVCYRCWLLWNVSALYLICEQVLVDTLNHL